MTYDISNINLDNLNIEKFELSIERLLKHSKNKNRFKKAPFLTSTGGIDSCDYTGKSIKRSRFSQKHFQGTKFINSAAAGSYFTKCNFEKCQFINANFQECTFLNSTFLKNSEKNPITNCNFNNSLFTDDFLLQNLYFQHSIFQGTAFINGTIKNTTFFSSTLIDTFFSNVCMQDICFNDLNIDYAVFQNMHMSNVILPFSQICFTFGLLPYLMNTKDEIYITSSSNKNRCISVDEFLSLLPDFETYYLGTKDFFPLANIYLAKGEFEKARNAILTGILFATTTFDFRQIKYLSKLIYAYPVFDFHQRKNIYNYINEHISFQEMHPGLTYKYNTYKNEINCFLLDNNRHGIITCEIDILTDVYPDEPQKLGILLSSLEQIIEQYKSTNGEHNILCRHNSAEEIVVKIQDIYQVLLVTIPIIYSVFLGSFNLEEKWVNKKKNKLDMKFAREMKELEVEEKRIKVQRDRMALEKETAEYKVWKEEQIKKRNFISEEILRKNITDNNISIKDINYIIYGDIPSEFNSIIIPRSKNKYN